VPAGHAIELERRERLPRLERPPTEIIVGSGGWLAAREAKRKQEGQEMVRTGGPSTNARKKST
jgi:hypothetical protein